MPNNNIVVTTTNEFTGRSVVEHLGIVKGIVVRSPTIGQGLMGGLKNMVGGTNKSYMEMCEQARQHAYDLMIEHAEEMGATGIVGMRFDTGDISNSNSSVTEVLCYGTAVRLN